jgi:hypothetical protein
MATKQANLLDQITAASIAVDEARQALKVRLAARNALIIKAIELGHTQRLVAKTANLPFQYMTELIYRAYAVSRPKSKPRVYRVVR